MLKCPMLWYDDALLLHIILLLYQARTDEGTVRIAKLMWCIIQKSPQSLTERSHRNLGIYPVAICDCLGIGTFHGSVAPFWAR